MRDKFILLIFGLIVLIVFPFLLLESVHVAPLSDDDVSGYAKTGSIEINELMDKVLTLNQQNKNDEALNLLTKAIEKEEEGSLMRTLLLQTFDLFFEEEIRLSANLIKKEPKNIKAYIRAANSLALLGDSFRALELLCKGIQKNSKEVKLWLMIAKLELLKKREFEALDVYKEVIRLDAKNSLAYNKIATILINTKNLKEASSYAKKAINLEPNNPIYLGTMANVQFLLGDTIKAHEFIKRAIKLAPNEKSFKENLSKFNANDGLSF